MKLFNMPDLLINLHPWNKVFFWNKQHNEMIQNWTNLKKIIPEYYNSRLKITL